MSRPYRDPDFNDEKQTGWAVRLWVARIAFLVLTGVALCAVGISWANATCNSTLPPSVRCSESVRAAPRDGTVLMCENGGKIRHDVTHGFVFCECPTPTLTGRDR